MPSQNRVRKLTILSLILASGIALNLVEPPFLFFLAPGIKIGFSNIATLFALYYFGGIEAVLIGALRPIIVSLIKGNVFTLEFILSFSGSISASILMLIFKKVGGKKISIKGVSIIGGITHNFAQFVMIYIMTLNKLLLLYLPLLLFFGGVSGFIIGLITQFLINRLKKFENEEKLTSW